MLRFHRFLGSLVAVSVIGFGCLAHGQSGADPQQLPAAPDAQAAAVQAAQDPDTANQIQQLQAAIDQLQQQVSRLTSAVEELQADRAESVKAAPAPKSKGKAPATSKKTVALATTAPVSAVPATDETTPLTVLVFQDGHRTEARNYAI